MRLGGQRSRASSADQHGERATGLIGSLRVVMAASDVQEMDADTGPSAAVVAISISMTWATAWPSGARGSITWGTAVSVLPSTRMRQRPSSACR